MTVTLDPQLEALIAEKIASGRYQSASEVIREALRLLEETERFEAEHPRKRGLLEGRVRIADDFDAPSSIG